ncbi:hypothetical protein HDU78_005278 [Chytriomyces hyalinus]|nr:hypothetical protein HDU78_005278 [Chytriomyces hyalinus]
MYLTQPLSLKPAPARIGSYNKRYKRLLVLAAVILCMSPWALLIFSFMPRDASLVGGSDMDWMNVEKLTFKAAVQSEIRHISSTTPTPTNHTRSPREHILLALASHTESDTCDYYMNAQFLEDPVAQPHRVCSSEKLVGDPLKPSAIHMDVFDMNRRLSFYRQKREWARGFKTGLVNEELQPWMKDYLKSRERVSLVLDSDPVVPPSVGSDGLGPHDDVWKEAGEISWSLRKDAIQSGTSLLRCGILDTNIPQRYCDSRNVAMKLNMVPPVTNWPGLDLRPPFGVLEASCHLSENEWFGRGFGDGAAGWMFDGMEIVPPQESATIECDAWIDTTLFFISRWDTTNPYQFHQDAMNTFLVYSLLQLHPSKVQPVILDSRNSDGPYTAAWSHIFSSSRHLVDVRQIRDTITAALKQNTNPLNASPVVCFKRAVWGIHGGISPLSRGGTKKTKCENAPLLFAFRDFMLERIWDAAGVVRGEKGIGGTVGAWRTLPVASLENEDNAGYIFEEEVRRLEREQGREQARNFAYETVVVTYAVRNMSTSRSMSEKGILGSTVVHGVAGTKQRGFSQDGRVDRLKRIIPNEAALIQALKEWADSYDVQEMGIKIHFRAVDFAALAFEDQVAIAQGTDFYIGPHGAAFVHLLYLRQLPFAAVLELKPPERGAGNQQFQNLALKMGNQYDYVSTGSSIDREQMSKISSAATRLLDTLTTARNAIK